MHTIICTLFEGHYHYGLAALINSLHKHGFKGELYAGYRGELPLWAAGKVCEKAIQWPGATTLTVAPDLHVHFLPLTVQNHFTNYKPYFVIELFDAYADVSGIFYFDPDIVIKCKWAFFEQWLSFGVPVVHEITNNDMPASHPVRNIWHNIIRDNGMEIKNSIQSYINAGFWAVKREDIGFAYLYKKFVEISIADFNIDAKNFSFDINRTHPFFAKDQDALNLAAMCTDVSLSEYGPEAMDLIHGGEIMSHAIGSNKPWKKNYLASFSRGIPPSLADKQYWNHVSGVINLYSASFLKLKKFELNTISFLSRFYRKS